METLETHGNSDGNTSKSSEKRIVPARFWCFTSYYDKMETLESVFSYFKILYIIGHETCPSTGKKHLQGYIECPTKIRPLEKFKNLVDSRTHWEKRIGTSEQNIEYCSKEENFRATLHVKKQICKYNKKEMILADWMIGLCKKIEFERDDRTINWVVDKVGGKGKTAFCKWIIENYKNVAYFTGGKANDITYQLIEMNLNPDLCLFDLPRTNEGKISYNALEQIKNGIINSSKYKGGTKIFNPPTIIVFANFEPDYTMLSADRWNIIML